MKAEKLNYLLLSNQTFTPDLIFLLKFLDVLFTYPKKIIVDLNNKLFR
jgi:hypothetical protein